MIFNAHQFKLPLNEYIESMFHFKGFMPDHSVERVVPTGHVFILFELDGLPRHTFDNKTLKPNRTFTKAWVSGMHKNYISISAHENSEMFVIQFKAQGCFPFFHQSTQKLNEKIVSADTIFDGQLLELRKQLLAKKSSSEKFKQAEHWLSSRFDPQKTPPAELIKMLGSLQKEPAARYQEILQSYPNSQKHLIDQFKKYVGLTPKYYHRILRFNDILQRIYNQEKIDWSEIAYSSGYTDQSHFIKEFKHFSGFNPREFIQQERHHEEANFFPLDRQ